MSFHCAVTRGLERQTFGVRKSSIYLLQPSKQASRINLLVDTSRYLIQSKIVKWRRCAWFKKCDISYSESFCGSSLSTYTLKFTRL